MKVTVLIDNISHSELQKEWGLAVHIAHEGKNILLDTGYSDKFLDNAEALGIDIGAVDYGVLSHAHDDHANGLRGFFQANKTAKFYFGHDARENCYSKKWRIFSEYIGVPKGITTEYKERIVYAEPFQKIDENVYLMGHREKDLGHIGKAKNLYKKENGRIVPDNFDHEQSLIFDTEEGLIIFNSCSHAGGDRILAEVTDRFPGKPVLAYFGGLHLYDLPDAEVHELAENMKPYHIGKLYTGHCTSQSSFDLLKGHFGDVIEQFYSGMSFEL